MNENVRSEEETKETPFNNVTSADVTLFVHQRALCSFANGSVCLDFHKHNKQLLQAESGRTVRHDFLWQ